MTQCELQEEKEQIEDLKRQRTDYLNRAERIAERLTTLKAEHKEHIVETKLKDISIYCDKIGCLNVKRMVEECLQVLQDK